MRLHWIAKLVIGGAALAVTTGVVSAQAVRITPVGPGSSTPPPATPPPATATPSAPATTGTPAVIVPVNPSGATSSSAPATSTAVNPAQPMAVAPQGARKLQVSFANGRVTVIAANVTLREILAEWSRQGGTRFIDADKVTGGPVSFEFRDRPEAEVLTSLLRPLPGYGIGGTRNAPTGSRIATVSLLAVRTTTPSSSGFVAPPAPTTTMPDDELPPVMPRPQAPATPTPVTVAPVGPAAPGTTGTGRGGGPGGY